MKTYESKEVRLELRKGLLADISCSECVIDFVAGSSSTTTTDRPVLRNIYLQNVAQLSCHIWGAVIEELTVKSLKRHGRVPMMMHACVFKHVTLSGPISSIKLNPEFTWDNNSTNKAWDAANRAYYQDVDWALDIREAEFKGSISLEAVPGQLVRRDPETQILIHRNTLGSANWKEAVAGTAVGIAIEWFIERSPFDDCVLVAPKRTKHFRDDLKIFERLRREKMAD